MSENNKNNWRYPVIQENKIDKEAIKFVSEKLKISELWIKRMHDFQWEVISEYIGQGKTVYVPGMFRVILRMDMLNDHLTLLDKRRTSLINMLSTINIKIAAVESGEVKLKPITRLDGYKVKKQQLEGAIKEVDNSILHFQKQVLERASPATKPGRQEYHKKKMKEDNKAKKIKKHKIIDNGN